MRNAAKKLKDIVSNKDIVPLLTHFIFREGLLHASNGILEASAVCDLPVGTPSFIVRASELYPFLDKASGDLKVSVEENNIIRVKCGRLKADFPGFADDSSAITCQPIQGGEHTLPPDFAERLRRMRPFVSDNATKPFATCILVRGDDMYATSNVVIATSPCGLGLEGDLLLHHSAADYLITHGEGLTSVKLSPEGHASYFWEDGSWLTVPKMDVIFPDLAPVLADVRPAEWELTAEWKSAWRDISRLTDENVHIYDRTMTGKTKLASEFEAELATLLPDDIERTGVTVKYLDPVFSTATHISIYKVGKFNHISFKGSQLSGVGMSW